MRHLSSGDPHRRAELRGGILVWSRLGRTRLEAGLRLVILLRIDSSIGVALERSVLCIASLGDRLRRHLGTGLRVSELGSSSGGALSDATGLRRPGLPGSLVLLRLRLRLRLLGLRLLGLPGCRNELLSVPACRQ